MMLSNDRIMLFLTIFLHLFSDVKETVNINADIKW